MILTPSFDISAIHCVIRTLSAVFIMVEKQLTGWTIKDGKEKQVEIIFLSRFFRRSIDKLISNLDPKDIEMMTDL